MTNAPPLQLHDIVLAHRGRRVLDGVSLAVPAASIVTLIGPNGAGKTSLIRIALGLSKADGGTVVTRPGLRIGYMPQHVHIPDTLPLTVERFLGLGGATRKAIREAASLTGIGALMSSPMQGLSGGERQRALLCRALAAHPDLLVLDEPVQGIDVAGQNSLYRLIADLRDARGCAVLMVSHDLHLVMAATDDVVCLNNHVCCSGHPDTVTRHPAYLELFGEAGQPALALYTHHHDHTHDIHGDVVEPGAVEHRDG